MLACLSARTAHADEDDVLVQIHYHPVPNAQIAVWLEDAEGNFVRDVFVTQATGKLGIGNRPGRWDFLSSWRFPYGPRPNVLPVWAHARGKSYPQLIFHDDDESDLDSLGWHENSSSPEPYFCRPLTQSEHDVISTDTMTCPSPSTFQSDKGRFADAEVSFYPPRADLIEFEDGQDHPDVMEFSSLNDLDSVTGATPPGDRDEVLSLVIPADIAAAGPLVARLEIHIEADTNADYDFDREADHFIDPRLSSFGIPWRGQPSVVYEVQFDPLEEGFTGTDTYAGYGSLEGNTGELNPPDDSISNENGSGADRLQLFEKNDEIFRFGVYSHGPDSGGSDDGGSPWGGCSLRELPVMTELDLEPLSFDSVRVHFTVPEMDGVEINQVQFFARLGEMPLQDDNASSATEYRAQCEIDEIAPGMSTFCDINELFGASDYQVGVRYEDECGNRSGIVADEIRTPNQEFATVDGFCFVATAAWGAPWAGKVQALRWFRDLYMKQTAFGSALVAFYYAYSPAAARLIARSPTARALARDFLAPVAGLAVLVTRADRWQ